MKKYVAFLRGINVGGHHKLPMADLKILFKELGFNNTITLLNSGNAIFETNEKNTKNLESIIGDALEKKFGFIVPTIVRTSEFINKLVAKDPFKSVEVTKDIRLYVTFLKNDVSSDLALPWTSDDASYRILEKIEQTVLSVLDVSVTKTPKAMESFDKFYGKDVTTRNWNTIHKIKVKLDT